MRRLRKSGNKRAVVILKLSSTKPATVQELLNALPKNSLRNCLCTAASHVANFFNTPLDQLPIDSLVDLPYTFRLYLKERRYKPHSIRSYIGFTKILLTKAKGFGWARHDD